MPSLQEIFKSADVNHYGPHVPAELVRIVGGHSAAYVFAQVAYWHNKMGREFYKTTEEFAYEVAISKTQLKAIRKKLEPFGLRTSRKGNSALYYWIDWEAFEQVVARYAQEANPESIATEGAETAPQKNGIRPLKRRNPPIEKAESALCTLYTKTTKDYAESARSSQLEDRTIVDEYPSSESRFHEQLKGRGDPVIKGLQARDFFRFNCSQKLCNLYPDKLADWFRNRSETELLRIWKFSAGARPGKLREWNMHDMLEGTLDIPSKPRDVEKAEKEVQNALRMVSILGAEDALAMLEPETRRVYTDWHGKTPEQAAAS